MIAVAEQVKTCTRCGASKPHAEFGKAKASKDGLFSYCKPCASDHARKWREKNPEKAAEKDRRWRACNRDRVAAMATRSCQRQRSMHPEKARARWAVGNAIREGRLEKPSACPSCDVEVPPIDLHAHHEDYSKPLEVEWLCRDCHNALHAEAL